VTPPTVDPPFSRPTRQSPAWKRWLVLGFVVLCVGGSALFYWLFTAPGRHLVDALAEADELDPGWRFEELEARRARLADSENSALVVLNARALLPKNWTGVDMDSPIERSLDDLQPQQQLNNEQILWLQGEREKCAAALAEAMKLQAMSRGRYPLRWRRGDPSIVQTSHESRFMALLLQREFLLQAQLGEHATAVQAVKALVQLSRSVGDEPLLISQLARTGNMQLTLRCLERLLAQGEYDDTALAPLQALLAEDLTYSAQLVGLRGERAGNDVRMEAVQNGSTTLRQLVGRRQGTLSELTERVKEGAPGYQRACLLHMFNQAVEIAKLPPHEQEEKFKLLEQSTESMPAAVRLLFPSILAVSTSFHCHDAELRCAIAALAAERYRLKHNRWPANIEDLVPEFLASVPLDPFTGRPILLRTTNEGVTVWSVGPDRQDNEGFVDPELSRRAPGQDLRFRLWNPELRRQPARLADSEVR